jgi:hypothetical protein
MTVSACGAQQGRWHLMQPASVIRLRQHDDVRLISINVS